MKLVEKLIRNRILSKEEFVELLANTDAEDREILRKEGGTPSGEVLPDMMFISVD